LSNGFNLFDNQLYHVNGLLMVNDHDIICVIS